MVSPKPIHKGVPIRKDNKKNHAIPTTVDIRPRLSGDIIRLGIHQIDSSTYENYELLKQIYDLAENAYMKKDETYQSMFDGKRPKITYRME